MFAKLFNSRFFLNVTKLILTVLLCIFTYPLYAVDDSNFKANEFVCQIINNLEESEYWTNYYNCLINMSNKFKDRTISFQSIRMTDKNVASIVKKIFDAKTTNDAEKEDYIKEIESAPVSKKDDYIDVSSVIEKRGYRLYKMESKS